MTARGSKTELRNSLRAEHRARRGEIRKRLAEFRAVTPDRYFFELVYCMLTPQSSAVNAGAVQQRLEELHFDTIDFDPEQHLGRKESYIRFHKTKARLLVLLKGSYPEVARTLESDLPAFELRERLIETVKGIGYKEATHFLRNIGRNEGLAILDRHIMRNLVKYGVLRSVPPSLTRKRYLALEEKFRHFSDTVGIPIDELDLLFWSRETGQILK